MTPAETARFTSLACGSTRAFVRPPAAGARRNGCTETPSGVPPLAAFGKSSALRTGVDYENTPVGALVRRAQASDEAAFREIVERYQSKVFSIIHGKIRQRNDVEDISQQVFAKVYFSIRNFDFRSSLITWIYKITVPVQLEMEKAFSL